MATLAIGAAAYYALETADRLLLAQLRRAYPDPIPTATTPEPIAESASAENASPQPARSAPSNPWLERVLTSLRKHRTISVQLTQRGRVDGRNFRSRGVYLQSGAGADQRFQLRLQGVFAGEPARLLRVSDRRFLWTDLQWGAPTEVADREIARIDLRQVRRALTTDDASEQAPR